MKESANHPTNVQKVGNVTQDVSGSHVAVVRMYPDRAYIGIPEILKEVINESNVESWRKICEKIDYIYKNLNYIFTSLEKETMLKDKLQLDIKKGKILLFKPNIVNPIIVIYNDYIYLMIGVLIFSPSSPDHRKTDSRP